MSMTSNDQSFNPELSIASNISYKIITKQVKTSDKPSYQIENLYEYQKVIDTNLEKSAAKINKEKYKECTFKPKINARSKILDSSPSVLKNSNSYLSLKDTSKPLPRTEKLYEFASISRNMKKSFAEEQEKAQTYRSSYSPGPKKPMRSKESTPVKGLENVVKRLEKARLEKEWTKNMMERGVVIAEKNKLEIKDKVDKIAEILVNLPNGGSDKIKYCRGDNLNYLVSEFCIKHKLTPDYHDKIVKNVLKNSKNKEN